MNSFNEAGSEYRNQLAKSAVARDQAVDRLNEIAKVCAGGIKEFYSTAIGDQSPDVYLERPSGHQITIRYGFRPAQRMRSVLKGPLGVIFVTPEGKTLLAKYKEWIPYSHPDPDLIGAEMNVDNWKENVEKWLIEFIKDSEDEYRRVSAQ